MQNIRLSIAWVIAGISLCALGLMLLTGQPFTAKAQESKRISTKSSRSFLTPRICKPC